MSSFDPGRPDAGKRVGQARLEIGLTVLLAVVFLGSVLFNAFDPQGLAVPVAADSLTTSWFVYGLGLIVGSWLLSVIYVVIANRAGRRILSIGVLLVGLTLAPGARAAEGQAEPGLNATAIGMFLALLLVTMGITVWASRCNQICCRFLCRGRPHERV